VNNFDFEVHNKGKLGYVGDPIDKSVVHHFLIPSPPRKDGQAPDPKRALLRRQPKLFFIFVS